MPSLGPGVALVALVPGFTDGIDGSKAGPVVAADGVETSSLTFGVGGGACYLSQAPSNSTQAQSAPKAKGVFMKLL